MPNYRVITVEGVNISFNFNDHTYNINTTDSDLTGKIHENKGFIKLRGFIHLDYDHEHGLLDENGRKKYTKMLEDIAKESIEKQKNNK